MEIANTRTVKAKLSEYLNSLEKKGPVVITSNGKPKALLLSFSEEDLLGLLVQNSGELHDAVMEGMLDVQKGKTLSVKEARDKLNKRNAA